MDATPPDGRDHLRGDAVAPVTMRPGTPPVPGRATRVAVVTTVHRWGDPRVFERETEAWLDWGCEVHVFVPALEVPERRGWSESPLLHIHALRLPKDRRERIALALGVGGRVRREGPFDLVQFHDPELIPAMAWLALGWPRAYFLYDVHEELPLEVRSKEWLPALLRPLVSAATVLLWRGARIAFEGFAPATEAIARYWPEARTRIVHNYPKSLFGLPADEAARPDPDRLLYVGGLSEVRGIRGMFGAVRQVRVNRPGLRLELYGPVTDVSLASEVARAVSEGWCQHTDWLPPEQLSARCRGAGIGLVPYLPIPNYLEALPTKLFEYMALGVPILASDFPLWRELVAASGSGRVADPLAPAYAATLEAMLADAGALAAHATRGREAYRTRYRWEAECEQLRWHLDRARAGIAS